MNSPWIDIQEGQDSLGPPEMKFSALFALVVQPKGFEVSEGWRWGFANRAVLDEGLVRLTEFVSSIHHHDFLGERLPDNRAVALRYYYDQSARRLVILLIGKISGRTSEQAGFLARMFYHLVISTAPYDYKYIPITEEEEFYALTKTDLIGNAAESVEIHRFESPLEIGGTTLYALGKWNTSAWSNEKVWRLLTGFPQQIVVNVLVKPVSIRLEERAALAGIAQQIKDFSSDAPDALAYYQANWLSNLFEERLTEWHFPYVVQVHLFSSRPIPDMVVQTIGSSYCSAENSADVPLSGFRYLHHNGKGELLHRILKLEPHYHTNQLPSPVFLRMRYMFGAQETVVPFRLPFPPKPGLPGVDI